MKERLIALRPVLIRAVGYPTFFFCFFLVFAYVTFPYDRLKEALIAAIEAPRRSPSGATVPSNMEITIGDLGPTFLPGLRARNVNITFLPTRPTERATTMHLDEATVHVGLFALLGRTLKADLDLRGLGGTIEGRVVSAMDGPRPGLRETHLTLSNVRVGEIAPLRAAVGLPLFGAMSGTIDLRVPDGLVNQASGQVRLTINGLKVGDGREQLQIPSFGALTVEQINAGQLRAAIDIQNGVATIREFAARSNEFQLAMDGRIELAAVLPQSTMNAGVRFRLTDAYRNKSEQAGRIMMALDFMGSARRPDGMLAFRCRGTLDGNLRCPPDGRGGAGGPPGLPGGRRGF